MDWIGTLGVALITGVVTLSGVALQNSAAAKRAKLEHAERADAERVRIAREDSTAQVSRAEKRAADVAVLAGQVAETFVQTLSEVGVFQEVDDDGFRKWFDQEWRRGSKVTLRRAVGRVVDDSARGALTEVLEILDSQAEFMAWNGTRASREYVEKTLTLGLDIAMALERGQDYDDSVDEELDLMQRRIEDWRLHVRREEEAKWEELRREFKIEELRHEAMMDAAREAEEEAARDEEERDAARGAEEIMHTYDSEDEGR